jgi:hypothetical protein
MSIKIGSSDATLKVGSTDVIEITKGGTRIYPGPVTSYQYWIVEPCGGGAQTYLQIDSTATLTAGQAIRPVTEPGGTTPIPGYESPICWTLIGNAPTGTGTYCGIRAPAADCTQAVCL